MQVESHPCHRVEDLRRREQAEARKEETRMRSVAILLMLIGAVCLSGGAGEGSGPGAR